ncbi:hypothetical protein INT45_008593 [Circinella minor]|uniref:Tetraspanin n=1 Tax=Circinella minor TaxID=1195481 RepID=A0A8H7S0Y0_9FUNG|nr:hypothetical protein INT45_008593 [Circinella minor]
MIAFSMMSTQHKIQGSILFPVNILKMVNILGLIICFTAVIGLIGAFYQERQAIHILYTTIVIIALIYQISIAVIVYEQAAHTTQWLSQTWSEATQEYRTFAENKVYIHTRCFSLPNKNANDVCDLFTKFSCCGYTHAYDHPVPTATCQVNDIVNSAPPCYQPLTKFMQHNLQIIYIVLFAAISIEILALCNAITLLCARYVGTMKNDTGAGTTSSPRRWITKSTEIFPEETIPMGSRDESHNKKFDQTKMIDSVISIDSDERHYRQY